MEHINSTHTTCSTHQLYHLILRLRVMLLNLFEYPKFKKISTGENIQTGDKILVNGSIADHGIAVMSARNELKVQADVLSDCAPLNRLIQNVLKISENVGFSISSGRTKVCRACF